MTTKDPIIFGVSCQPQEPMYLGIGIVSPPDLIKKCDMDIRKSFEGTNYLITGPTDAQIFRDVKKILELLESR